MKKCKYCQSDIDANSLICPVCKKRQDTPKLPKWAIILIIIVAIGIIGSALGGDDDSISSNTSNNSTSSNTTNNTNEDKKDGPLGLGSTFTFDDLEITLGTDISYTTVQNQFSDHNNATVIKIPITTKNLKNESHSLNMFYYDLFGSQGTELDGVSAYFSSEDVDYAGEIRPGATGTSYIHMLYDGNGTYAIEFSNYREKITVEFQINR